MFKFINYFKEEIKNTSLVAIATVFSVGTILMVVGNTYAANSYKIVFNRAENTEVMKTCYTNQNGKLDEECISVIRNICNQWSLDVWNGGVQSNPINSTAFRDLTFSRDTNYYCVAGTSGKYDMGCYVCKNDETIMHWGANGNSDSNCPSGYYKTNTPEKDCKPVIPESCYVCKNDSNVMKWDNNGDSDNNCSSGYTPIDKPIDECKTIVPNTCYVCKNDENIMKWDNNGGSDNNCKDGYYSVNKPLDECKTIIPENPPTGDSLISMVYVIGFLTLVYAIYYFKNMKLNKNS